jgi:hypothetical protein
MTGDYERETAVQVICISLDFDVNDLYPHAGNPTNQSLAQNTNR